jgi:hypothetical protein
LTKRQPKGAEDFYAFESRFHFLNLQIPDCFGMDQLDRGVFAGQVIKMV